MILLASISESQLAERVSENPEAAAIFFTAFLSCVECDKFASELQAETDAIEVAEGLEDLAMALRNAYLEAAH
jgi:hypothetical protein